MYKHEYQLLFDRMREIESIVENESVRGSVQENHMELQPSYA